MDVNPFDSIAKKLAESGVEQDVLYNSFRFAMLRMDGDDSNYDLIADTLDRITGWCSPHQKLYEKYYNES